MAFLDLEIGSPLPLSRAVETELGAQERRVVHLARTDQMVSLRRGRLGRIAHFLFGIEAPHRLADARLEALRRYAILYRVKRDTPDELSAARAAGFSDGELAIVRALTL